TLNATSGLAAFSNLTLDKASSGYTLQTSSPGLGAAVTSSITVQAGTATQLVVATPPPSSITAGSGFGLVVSGEDPFGNVDPNFARSVSVLLAGNPGGGPLGGTLTASASSGVATFSNLTLNKAGSGYALQASASNLNATSNAFDVKA